MGHKHASLCAGLNSNNMSYILLVKKKQNVKLLQTVQLILNPTSITLIFISGLINT